MRAWAGSMAAILLWAAPNSSATAALLPSPLVARALIEQAKARGDDARALANRPDLKPPKAFCSTRAGCAKYCDGAKAIADKVRAAAKSVPQDLVDPAVAVQAELKALGCTPQGGGDLREASANCGLRFVFDAEFRRGLPALAAGLARAALEAVSRGYVLLVGSTYRGPVKQTSNVCENIDKGLDKVCGATIACPGGSKHGSGYAVDVGLMQYGTLVTKMTGSAGSCSSRRAIMRKSTHQRALLDSMLAAGWWWYCKELWHFEYSLRPADSTRVSRLEKK